MVILHNDSEYILKKKFKNGNEIIIKYSKEVFKTDIYVNGVLKKTKQFNYRGKLREKYFINGVINEEKEKDVYRNVLVYRSYCEEGKLVSETRRKDKDSPISIKTFYKNGTIFCFEKYSKDGLFIDRKFYDKKGNLTNRKNW
jgi:antitoxin component YwqK of YwqJK toxin-antitoxin module